MGQKDNEALLEVPPLSRPIQYNINDSIRIKDPDTVVYLPENKNIRFQGASGAETAKFLPEQGVIKGSQRGADLQTRLVSNLLQEKDYDTPVYSNSKSYDRELGDLVKSNSGQRSASNELLNKGILNPSTSATQEQLSNYTWGNLWRANRKATGKATSQDLMLEKLHDEMFPGGSIQAKLHTTTAKQFNQADRDYFIGPAIIGPDETNTGEAKNNWSTGITQGWTATKQGLFGTMEMLGEKTGIDWLKNVGSSNVKNYEHQLAQLPYLRNGEAFDEKGNWKLDSFGKVLDFTIGQAAASAPQMLTTIVAGLSAPITMGASLSVPAAIYTGQTWNNQDLKNKNATAAILSGITQAVLDDIGLPKGLLPKGLDITKPATQALVKDQLLKRGLAATPDIAEQMVIDAGKKNVAEVSKVLRAETLKQSLGPKAIVKSIGKGIATESPTEFLQELAGVMGEKVTLNPFEGTPKEQQELKNRLLGAAVGGAVLGGTFGGAATALRTATTRPDKDLEQNTDSAFRKEWMIRSGTGKMFSTLDVLNSPISAPTEEADLNKMAEFEESKRAINGKISSWWADKGFGSLWDKSANIIMQGKSYADEYMATLSTLIGATRAAIGGSIDETQALVTAKVFSGFGTKEDLQSAFNGESSQKISEILSDPNVSRLITQSLDIKNNHSLPSAAEASKSSTIDLGANEKYRDAILKYADKLDLLVKNYNEAIDAKQNKLTVESFLNNKPLNKAEVVNHASRFSKDLQNAFGLSPKEANDLVQNIINNDQVVEIEDMLDELLNPRDDIKLSKDELVAGLNKPENKAAFSRYLSNDVLNNAYSLAHKAGAMHVNKHLIGKNGSKLAMLIQKSLEQGSITPEVASFQAKELKDWLNMRNGKYRPPLHPFMRGALSTINFLSTITSLPLAAISSTVEFAQVYRNLNTPQAIKATKLLLSSTGKELASIYKEIGSKFTNRVKVSESTHRSELSAAGYLKEGGIGQRNDVLHGFFQQWNEGFFKITGLTSITTITRHARLGIASDAIQNWISVVENEDGKNSPESINEAYDHLTRIGVDVELMLSAKSDDPYTNEKLNANMALATYNFVNEAINIPTQLNRPKFYSDPYLQLFTQFQGYTSAFTANILPRLVKDLAKAGSPDQKNAASVIAMMFALSLLALYLKDMIKYGESPPEWLKDDKKFQRVVSQMGILGTGQRVWDTLDPMFDDKKEKNAGILRQVWKNVSDQSPQLSYINKLDDVISAPDNKQIGKAARLLPIFGTSPQFAKYLQKELGN